MKNYFNLHTDKFSFSKKYPAPDDLLSLSKIKDSMAYDLIIAQKNNCELNEWSNKIIGNQDSIWRKIHKYTKNQTTNNGSI